MSGILLAEYSPPTACKRVVSGTISLPSQGFFSPFPHGTGSRAVANKYLAFPDGPGRFPQGSTCPAVLRSHLKLRLHFHLRGCHPLWPAFPDRSINTFLSLVVTTGLHGSCFDQLSRGLMIIVVLQPRPLLSNRSF